MKLTPRNWSEFQHYKDRRPPWIKLHKALLDDRDFHALQDASRALAPDLWLIASEHSEGEIDASVDNLTFRLRRPWEWIINALVPLVQKGFFIADSELLALCKHDAPDALFSPLVVKPEDQPPTPSQESPGPRKRRAEATPFPADFAIDEGMRTWAKAKGFGRLDEHLEAFRAKCLKVGRTYVDWRAAFQEAVREDWAGLRGKNGNHAAGAPANAWKAGAEPTDVLVAAADLLEIPPWAEGETFGQFRARIVAAGGESLLRGRG